MLNTNSETFSVGILGLGLIGGSLAKRLAKENCTVYAYNRHSQMYNQAKELGIICVDSVKELALKKPNVLFLCNSLSSMPIVLSQLEHNIDKSITTLSDVGSVKSLVRQQVKEANLADCYVGAHPMAGSEFTGWEASCSELLDSALWALTVDSFTQLWRVANVLHVITNVCKNRAIVINDSVHDKSAALISHMPHVVATALANVLCNNPNRNIAIQLAAGSWRDMTRVSLTDPQRTRAMVSEDRDNVSILLRSLIAQLDKAASMLEDSSENSDDAEREFFDEAKAWREYKYAMRLSKSKNISKKHLEHGCECGSCECGSCECDSSSSWRENLLNSAKKGEEIIGISNNKDFFDGKFYAANNLSIDSKYSYEFLVRKNANMLKFMR